MKKILVLMLGFLLAIQGQLFAARTVTESLIASTTLDADPTSASGTAKVSSADKIAVFVTYDETEVGASVSAAVTVDVSWDGSTWLDASFYDYAGGATLQTTETISADGNYYLWFNRDIAAPYVRVVITGANTDADDIAVVSAKLITQE